MANSAIKSIPVPESSEVERSLSYLDVAFTDEQGGAPPGYVLVTSPDGKQTGMRPGWAASKQDIPSSEYVTPLPPESTEDGPIEVVAQVALHQVMAGKYMVEIAGVKPRRAHLFIRAQRANHDEFGIETWGGVVPSGRTDTVWVDVAVGLDTAVATRSVGHN